MYCFEVSFLRSQSKNSLRNCFHTETLFTRSESPFAVHIFVCLSNILNVKNLLRTVKNLPYVNEAKNSGRMNFFTLCVDSV